MRKNEPARTSAARRIVKGIIGVLRRHSARDCPGSRSVHRKWIARKIARARTMTRKTNATTFDATQRILNGSQIGRVMILNKVFIGESGSGTALRLLLLAGRYDPPGDDVREHEGNDPRHHPGDHGDQADDRRV